MKAVGSTQPMSAPLVNNKSIKRLDALTNWLLAAIVIIPFFISFGALRGLAADNGVSYPILYPLMVDGGLIIFKLLALRESLRGKRDSYTWGMAISLTVISVLLNILHVPHEIQSMWLARFMAALPPLVILASFIAVSRRIEETARMEGAVIQHEQIVKLVERKRRELDEMVKNRTSELEAFTSKKQAEIDEALRRKRVEVDDLTLAIEQLTQQKLTAASELQALQRALNTEKLTLYSVGLGKSTPKASSVTSDSATNLTPQASDSMGLADALTDANDIRTAKKEEALDALLAYLDAHPDATITEAADVIGRSRSTVSGYVMELTENGRLHKNGHGWEVLSGQ